MTGKTSSSLQAVIVIHICSFPKQHTYFSFHLYYLQTRSHLFVNKRCKQDTEKIILWSHASPLRGGNTQWCLRRTMMLGIQATMPSVVLGMNLAGAMILLKWASTEWNAVYNYPCNSCRHIMMKFLQSVKISFSRLCKVFFSLSKCNQSSFQ